MKKIMRQLSEDARIVTVRMCATVDMDMNMDMDLDMNMDMRMTSCAAVSHSVTMPRYMKDQQLPASARKSPPRSPFYLYQLQQHYSNDTSERLKMTFQVLKSSWL